MSGGYPVSLELCNSNTYGACTSTSNTTTISSATTANTKGSYTQLIASTNSDATWMTVILDGAEAAGSGLNISVDIAVGASGSEKIIVDNLYYSLVNSITTYEATYSFPCAIPKGTAISARCQDTLSKQIINAEIILFDSPYFMIEGCGGADSIGFNAGNTTGTPITANNTWIQLTSSTTRDYNALMVTYGLLAYAATGVNLGNSQFNIGVGSAGNEKILIPNIPYLASIVQPTYTYSTYYTYIPKGTRLCASVNAAANATTGPDIILYGIYQ